LWWRWSIASEYSCAIHWARWSGTGFGWRANVFINYYNEVLIEDPNLAQRYLVQRGSVPGTPKNLSCLRGVMCWTDADVATVAPLGGAGYRPDVVMTSTDVSFKDGAGEGMRVELR
jgi:hypothetical protein